MPKDETRRRCHSRLLHESGLKRDENTLRWPGPEVPNRQSLDVKHKQPEEVDIARQREGEAYVAISVASHVVRWPVYRRPSEVVAPKEDVH